MISSTNRQLKPTFTAPKKAPPAPPVRDGAVEATSKTSLLSMKVDNQTDRGMNTPVHLPETITSVAQFRAPNDLALPPPPVTSSLLRDETGEQ